MAVLPENAELALAICTEIPYTYTWHRGCPAEILRLVGCVLQNTPLMLHEPLDEAEEEFMLAMLEVFVPSHNVWTFISVEPPPADAAEGAVS